VGFRSRNEARTTVRLCIDHCSGPSVTSTDIWISLIVFVLIYLALGAADLWLMLRYSRKELGQDDEHAGEPSEPGAAAVPVLTY